MGRRGAWQRLHRLLELQGGRLQFARHLRVQVAAGVDVHAAEGAIVDTGLGDFNDAAAPLHEVRRLSCFARVPGGEVQKGKIQDHDPDHDR